MGTRNSALFAPGVGAGAGFKRPGPIILGAGPRPSYTSAVRPGKPMFCASWFNSATGAPLGVMAAAGAAFAAWLLLRRLRPALRNALALSFSRLHEQRFIYLLRAEAFADPLGVVMTLSGNNASWYLQRLWARAGDDVTGLAAGAGHADLAAAERVEPATAAEWRSQRLASRPVAAPGWALAVVTLPEARPDGHTHFVAVAVPSRLIGRGEAALARRAVRFFTGIDFIEY